MSPWIVHVYLLILVAAVNHWSSRLLTGVLALRLLDWEPLLARRDALRELANAALAPSAILTHLSNSELVLHHRSLLQLLRLPLQLGNGLWVHVSVVMRSLHHHRGWLNLVKRSWHRFRSSYVHLRVTIHFIIFRVVLIVGTCSLVYFPLLKYRPSWFVISDKIEVLRNVYVLLF